MADKEATVYVIDLGSTTADCHNGRIESDLDYVMRYVWDKITSTIAAGRKTWTVGVVGFRTDDTDNPMADDDDSYSNIAILKPLGPMELTDLRDLQESIKSSSTNNGDAISAVVIAIDMIDKFTTGKSGNKLKFNRRIILVTDGQGRIDADGIDQIAAKINESEIELVVIGVDFDDPDYGYKEEDKDIHKAENEKLLKGLTEDCNAGVFGTAEEAIEELSVPRIKTTRPYAPYSGQLTLGDPEKYETAICIDVERYFKIKAAKAMTATSIAVGSSSQLDSTQSSTTLMEQSEAGGLSAVNSSRIYRVNDPSAPGGKKEVDREELAKGFEYGRTAVHIAESDENVTKLETVKSFSIIGFIPMESHERFLDMGESCITIALRTNDKARMALSSFVHALHELDSYAVARLVAKDGKDPQILLLAPYIEPDLEGLIDVPLPFAEDVRTYRFPPLDKVIAASGAVMTKHRNLPGDDLVKAMGEYVDSMDLSEFGKDDEGNPTEYMTIEETFSPYLHRLNQAIRRRAVEPKEPVGPPADILVKWSHPPEDLVKLSAKRLDKLIEAASVKKVPPKVKGKRSRQDTVKPLSGLDVEALLGQEKRQKISHDNAVPEFRQMLTTAESVSSIQEAANQMASIIRTLVTRSLGDSGYGRALENLRVMREELLSLEEPTIYNDFIRDFKKRTTKGELGGDRRDFWWEIRKNRLGLIDNATFEFSDVSEQEASEFYSLKINMPSHTKSG
ncbi:SPOC like C-terminal domain-containing protein [Xylogone sp. PMI_703]|nr:SPOC like C-terminal domain-containing protein [Xylogone sp. PMI_703]